MKFSMSRQFVLAALGHAIAFEPDTPVHVPRELHRQAVAAGAQPVAESDEVDFEDAKNPEVHIPTDPAERAEMLAMALADLRNSEDRDIFTANGVPKVKAVSTILGYPVTANEVTDAWATLKQAEGA